MAKEIEITLGEASPAARVEITLVGPAERVDAFLSEMTTLVNKARSKPPTPPQQPARVARASGPCGCGE